MLKIKQKNCRFKVDREKQVVVCWVEGAAIANMVDNFMREHNIDIIQMGATEGQAQKIKRIVTMPKKVMGIATCYAGDEWDEELGKLIAFNKMKKKLMTLFFKHLQSAMDYTAELFDKMANAADAVGMRFETELHNREQAIENELNFISKKQ